MSKSLNAALRQLARAAACRWIAWLPFLDDIAKFFAAAVSANVDGRPNQPQQNSLAGLVSLCWGLVGVFVVLLAFGGLQAQRGGFKTHIMLGSIAGLCSLVHCWVGTCSVNFCQTNIVVSVRDLSGVGQCWIGSLLPCGGLHVL